MFLFKWNFICLGFGMYTGFILRDEMQYSNYDRMYDIHVEAERARNVVELEKRKIEQAILEKKKRLKRKREG